MYTAHSSRRSAFFLEETRCLGYCSLMKPVFRYSLRTRAVVPVLFFLAVFLVSGTVSGFSALHRQGEKSFAATQTAIPWTGFSVSKKNGFAQIAALPGASVSLDPPAVEVVSRCGLPVAAPSFASLPSPPYRGPPSDLLR